MREVEVAALLLFVNGLDQRQGTDELKVRAWASMFDNECADMDAAWAKGVVEHHYALTDDMLTPGHLVRAWKKRKALRYELEQEAWAGAEQTGEPMPEWFKSAMMEAFGHTDLGNLGAVKKSAAEIQGIFDRWRPTTRPRIAPWQAGQSHCGRTGCTCTHDRGCYKGWMEESQYAVPCKTCRTDLAVVLNEIPPPGQREPHHSAKVRNRYMDATP